MNTIDTQGVGALQAALTRQQINIAVLNKAQDAQQAQADAALKLLDSAAQIVSAGNPPGHAPRLDVTA